jgi:hypothetical protein
MCIFSIYKIMCMCFVYCNIRYKLGFVRFIIYFSQIKNILLLICTSYDFSLISLCFQFKVYYLYHLEINWQARLALLRLKHQPS